MDENLPAANAPADRNPAESKVTVVAALFANLVVAAAKFLAAWRTGSSAMLAEAIHSTIDTSNELLLLLGMRQSAQPPTVERPVGHGRELYFWAFVVAVFIFAIGGGFSLYEGYEHLRHPTPLRDPTWNYAVLALGFISDGASFVIAWRTFGKQRGRRPFWRAFRISKDPSVFMVLFEDAAALLGLLLAFLGVFLSHYLNRPALDGVASMAIGVLLLIVAGLLLRETKSLLLGEPAEDKLLTHIRELAKAQPTVQHVRPVLSSYLGPHEILVVLPVEFAPDLPASQLVEAAAHLRETIKNCHPDVRYVFVQPEGPQTPPLLPPETEAAPS
jgi:cation diffusion facilitator family transporter